jgi:hypothetical protein
MEPEQLAFPFYMSDENGEPEKEQKDPPSDNLPVQTDPPKE